MKPTPLTTVYRLNVERKEDDADGGDYDEWFGSLREAQKRRAELIREDPTLAERVCRETYAIDRVFIDDLPRKRLILAILNRHNVIGTSWQFSSIEAVPPYTAKKD